MLKEVIKFPFEVPPEEGDALEIRPGLLWIRLPLPMRLNHVNIYALDEGDGWSVIDTGMTSKRGRRIWEALMAGPLQGRPIKRVFLTHHHPDHVGNAGWLKTEFGAEIWTTRTAWLMARMLTLDVQETYPPESVAFFTRTGMPEEKLQARLSERPYNFADMVAPIPLGYKRIVDGQQLRIGQRYWTVRVGNGHAPEHATFWCDDDALVIAGDQIIPGISSNLGVYPTEPEADPVGEWLNSCENFKEFARPEHLVLPGHKLPFEGLSARLDQLIDNHYHALDRLMEHLEEPRVAADCFQPLFGREIEDGAYGLALVEAIGHLNHLNDHGKVSRELKDGVYVWQKR